MRFQELDVVRALVPLGNGIMPGDEGTIVYAPPEDRDTGIYDVEYVAPDGKCTLAYCVPADALELVISYEDIKKRNQGK